MVVGADKTVSGTVGGNLGMNGGYSCLMWPKGQGRQELKSGADQTRET